MHKPLATVATKTKMIGPKLIAIWNVRIGSKADMYGSKGHVRFTPQSDREGGFAEKSHVCFIPRHNAAF
jgi:hypothetical protein